MLCKLAVVPHSSIEHDLSTFNTIAVLILRLRSTRIKDIVWKRKVYLHQGQESNFEMPEKKVSLTSCGPRNPCVKTRAGLDLIDMKGSYTC